MFEIVPRTTKARVLAAFLLLLVQHTASGSSSSSADKIEGIPTTAEMFCPDLKPQGSLDLEQIMGEWHVVEVIKHKIDPLFPTSSGRVVIETCPSVNLRFAGHETLRLLWSERAGNLEYSFVVPNLSGGPGFWLSRDFQNGTLLTRNYVQFSGTVQVMKAVSSHMVLTFCSKTPDNQLYSMLLSRKHDLPESDRTGVHNLLSRRGLTIATIQESCTNAGSVTISVTRWTQTLIVVLALLMAAGYTTSFPGI